MRASLCRGCPRPENPEFLVWANVEVEGGGHYANYSQVQIVRVHQRGEAAKVSECCFKKFRHSPETMLLASGPSPTIRMDIMGPYRSEYGNLFELLRDASQNALFFAAETICMQIMESEQHL